MKKKAMILLALTAILSLGMVGMTALAAEGWAQSGNAWVYYDGNGNKVTNEWRRGADNQWRYLEASGQMAVNTWVDDNSYYVDSNGILVSDRWLKLKSNRSTWDNADEYEWYYFGNSGKVITDSWKKIDNKYYLFDIDGAMVTGWSDDYMYYLGDDGVMRTGWIYLLAPDEDIYEDDHFTPGDEGKDGKYWYYFTSNGKKYVPDVNEDENKQYKIDGVYYCFNGKGQMQTGWQSMGDPESTDITDYRYYDSDGKLRTGWYSTMPPEALSDNYDDEVQWYYFSNNGTPKSGPAEGSASTSDLVKINGNTYLFNELGNPVYGLQRVKIGSSEEDTAYYFGDKSVSSVVRGKVRLEEGGGDKIDYYFTESGSYAGRGYTGVKDNYLYYKGKLQRADSGVRYMLVDIPSGSKEYTYVVNSSGRVPKSTTVKASGGDKYKVNSKGQLVAVNGEDVDSAVGEEPVEPDWTY